MKTKVLSLLILFIIALPSTVLAQSGLDFSPGNKYVRTSLIADTKVFQPSSSESERSARLGVLLQIEEGWHLYWKNSGESGSPTKIEWKLPPGWRAGDLRWPVPTIFSERGEINTFGYQSETLLIADVLSPTEIPSSDQTLSFGAHVSWLVCKDVCLPGQSDLTLSLHYSSSAPLEPSESYNTFGKYEALTPKPLSALHMVEKLQGISVQPLVSTSEVAAGQKSRVGLLLSNVPSDSAHLLSALVQVFPDPVKGIRSGLASIVPVRDHDYLLSYPLTVSESAEPGKIVISGLLVLSPEITGLKIPLSLAWSTPSAITTKGSELTENPRLQSIAAAASQGLPLTFRLRTSPAEEEPTKIPVEAPLGLLAALGFAFLSGIILNFMPCVLPIISIKVMGFVNQAKEPRSHAIKSSIFFSLGILASFLALAASIILLRQVGMSVGWGFQFQQPAFVLGLLVVVFVLSLGFFDVFHFRLPGIQKANRFVSGISPGPASHFFDGVLATALSTPCTAPFLGTALAFAFSQPPTITIAIFLSIGLGLALPYALLTTQPRLLRIMPKPGNWMIRFRQLMGFLLLGTVLWLLFILHRQTNDGALWALLLLLLIFFATWVNRWLEEVGKSSAVRTSLGSLFTGAIVLFTVHFWPLLASIRSGADVSPMGLISWKSYSSEVLSEAMAAKRTVFIDFTADWCVTCKVNETLVLNTSDFSSLLKKHDAIAVKGDWTRVDEEITRAIKGYGGQGVPLYVIIPPNPKKDPVVLPSLLTPSIVRNGFEKAVS